MNALLRLIDRINGASGLIAAWLVVPLILATCFEVGSRYLFNAPTIWAYELGYMLTGAGFLLGMAYTLREGAHIRIDVLLTRMSPRALAMIDLAAYVLLLLPFLVWVTFTLDDRFLDALRSGERTGQSAWNPPVWPFRLVFLLSFALLLLQVVAEVVKSALVVAGRPVPGRATEAS